ncbi:hypothetical protein ACFPT7_15300 [Acidicapsa dinghuensis]|uniref:Uncharacterized protein n=1 Tax=Acidicapsa dinghuensis TaxID=2218256 RepID=A0ABW1EHU6_9BACT|nr:hypothetical protein [Acidicapsa dinghuensis]
MRITSTPSSFSSQDIKFDLSHRARIVSNEEVLLGGALRLVISSQL